MPSAVPSIRKFPTTICNSYSLLLMGQIVFPYLWKLLHCTKKDDVLSVNQSLRRGQHQIGNDQWSSCKSLKETIVIYNTTTNSSQSMIFHCLDALVSGNLSFSTFVTHLPIYLSVPPPQFLLTAKTQRTWNQPCSFRLLYVFLVLWSMFEWSHLRFAFHSMNSPAHLRHF